jgi:thiol-disulfide isomerase/thioredoxin
VKSNRTLMIVIGAIVAVLALAGVAVLVSGSGGDDDSTAPTPSYVGELAENRPVVVSGDPLPALNDAPSDPAIGATMPVVEGSTFDGQPITIGGATDGPTMYVFLAHWCPHCNDEIPELLELDDRGGLPAELDVVGISTAVDNTAPNFPPSKWVIDKGWRWPVLADDEAATSFVVSGGGGFPYIMIVDADGVVLDRASGTKSADELEAWLGRTLGASA